MTKRQTIHRNTQMLAAKLEKEHGEPIGVITLAFSAGMNYQMATNVDKEMALELLRLVTKAQAG